MTKSNAWVDAFQPNNVEDCFLPEQTRVQINEIIANQDVPSMLFAGPPGIGKTTLALAICNQLDLESMVINASLHGNIDTVRTDIHTFASSVSFNGKRKVIILDEADGISAAAQASLRGVINEFSDNVAFILTANARQKIIEPLISRLKEVDFLFSKAELPKLAIGLYNFIIARLNDENVDYDPKAVQGFIREQLQNSTDIRKILIRAQSIAKTKVFNTASLIDIDQGRMSDLVQFVKGKNFDKIRTWAGENSDIEFHEVTRYLYKNLNTMDSAKTPSLVIIINQYQYQHAFVIDKEINLVAMLAEISLAL